MSLILHLGNAGSGKTWGLRKMIIDQAAAEQKRSFLFVVPEQFTLETQRAVIEQNSTHGMFNIDAVSFVRLSHRVFEELGRSIPTVLEDSGKGMIVKKVAMEKKDELTVYRGKIEKQGFIEEMKSLIAEFYQYGIDLDKLEEMKKMADNLPQLKAKLHDIGILYEGFSDFIEGRFVMNEEILDIMCEDADRSELLRSCVLALDGFTGFTPSQYHCIETLMDIAEDIHVAITIDKESAEKRCGEDSLFYLSRKTIDNLERIAVRKGKDVRRIWYSGENGRFSTSTELAHLEKNIFRYPYSVWKPNVPESAEAEMKKSSISEQAEVEMKKSNISEQAEAEMKKPNVSEQAEVEMKKSNISEQAEAEMKKSNISEQAEAEMKKPDASGLAADNPITLLSAQTRYDEVAFTVAKTRELVFEKNYRYADIAVVTGDMAAYSGMLAREFEKAGIPAFSDEKRNIRGMAVVEMLEAALDILKTNYSYDSVFRFLKTGMTDIGADDISLLENYCLALGIRGYNGWKREWKRTRRNTGRPEEDGELQHLNQLREQVSGLLNGLYEAEHGKPDVRQRLTALYDILDRCGVERKLHDKAEMLKNSDDPDERVKEKQYSTLFALLVEIFERIEGLLGDERISLQEFTEILDTGFSEAKLRTIPGGMDSIVIGDIERTRLNNKKAVFFIGVNDDVIPKNNSSGGLLNDFDRELFAENDIELSPTKRENIGLAEFYLYLALTKPCERLYLTFSRLNGGGKEGRPAYVFGRILRIFEGLELEDLSVFEKDNPYRLLGADRGLTRLLSGIRTAKFEKTDGITAFLRLRFSEENPGLSNIIDKAVEGIKRDTYLESGRCRELYGAVIEGSITRLQQFAGCAFSYFLQYGLGLKEQEEMKIGGLELGVIYHNALEKYSELVTQKGLTWVTCMADTRRELEAEAASLALADYEAVMEKDARSAYLAESLNRVLSRTVDIVSAQLAAGEFDVRDVELSFIHANRFMKLRGKIDRLDVVQKKGKYYLRVIDYKTGSETFDADRLYYGLQLQLAVYLHEAVGKMKSDGIAAEPAGMFYYNIDDPITEAGKDSAEAVAKALRLHGISSCDYEILGLHDRELVIEKADGENEAAAVELAEGAKSKVIAVETKKRDKEGNVDFTKGSLKNLMTTDMLNEVRSFVTDKTAELARDIISGRVEVNPYELSGKTPCEYCIYREICGFDRKRGDRYRQLEPGRGRQKFGME